MPTVAVPVVGQVERKWLIGGGALVAVLVGYAYWRRRGSTSSTGIDPNAIDPLTGLTYAAEAAQTSGYVNPNPGASGADTVTDTSTTAITTNVQWSNAVESALGGIYDEAFITSTLGKYLAGQPLTSDEAMLVRAAWAFVGHPPDDKQIILTTTGSTPGGSNGTVVATRNGNLHPSLPSTSFHSWTDLARWAYWWSGHTDPTSKLNGLMGYSLAHANNQAGGSDPSKLKNIHLPDTLAVSA